MLVLRGISKHYSGQAAVDDVSLSVPPGEFLTLLGPSGSGKTTLLMLIAGFIEPTGGDILLDGQPITRRPPEKRNFGMVFQGYALFPHLSVFDNVAFPLRVRGRTKSDIAGQVRATLELVHLTALAERLPRQLSGGQQQRVALARALVFAPRILLLDEPLSALDKKLRAELQWELKMLHQQVRTTFIYVTHDQEEALSMSDRVAIIREGRIEQTGDPRALYEKPETRFVADFLGKSNFIRAAVVSLNDGGFTYEVEGATCVQRGAVGTIRAADTVLIALRPEKIRVLSAAPGDCGNGIKGEIASWRYCGPNVEFVVRTTGLGALLVTLQSWRLGVEPTAGRPVWLAWDDDASVVVRED